MTKIVEMPETDDYLRLDLAALHLWQEICSAGNNSGPGSIV
jgi:hypothetical protein